MQTVRWQIGSDLTEGSKDDQRGQDPDQDGGDVANDHHEDHGESCRTDRGQRSHTRRRDISDCLLLSSLLLRFVSAPGLQVSSDFFFFTPAHLSSMNHLLISGRLTWELQDLHQTLVPLPPAWSSVRLARFWTFCLCLRDSAGPLHLSIFYCLYSSCSDHSYSPHTVRWSNQTWFLSVGLWDELHDVISLPVNIKSSWNKTLLNYFYTETSRRLIMNYLRAQNKIFQGRRNKNLFSS